MRVDNLRFKPFTRRTLLLVIAQCCVFAVLLGRLIYLQFFQGRTYRTLSDVNRLKIVFLSPQRGTLYDRRGTILAFNRSCYRLLLNRDHLKAVKPIVAKLAGLLRWDANTVRHMQQKIARQRGNGVVVLYDHLSWHDVANVEVSRPDLPGVEIDVAPVRYYPFGSLCAHIVGYVGTASKQEFEDLYHHSKLWHPDIRIGKQGLERRLEPQLQGISGYRKMEVDAHGTVVREVSRVPSIAGNDQHVTLDVHLQELIHQQLPDQGATVVLLDVARGDVLSMASTPMFDPNQFTEGMSHSYWHAINHNPHYPMANKAIARHYAPGSTFKVVVALAALANGFDPMTRYTCTGGVEVGGHLFRCVSARGHGPLQLNQAIISSCNTYFYQLAKHIGVDSIAEMAKLLGLGERTMIELPGEEPGLIPTRAWKRERFGHEWQLGDTLNCGIGQGYILTTPVQMAVLTARIASGRMVHPRLLFPHGPDGLHWHGFTSLPIAAEALQYVRDAMRGVVNDARGTTFRHRITVPGMEMAGKTGTAQVISKETRLRLKGGEATKLDNHAHFIGFAPAHAPRYACAVTVENGGYGSSAAAPIGKMVLTLVQQHADKI
jgi:penicillin-binding protein 2